MVIFNNMAAMSALNETKRNDGTLGKVIKKAASGMKINSAGDDASGYSSSARMKVRLRHLNLFKATLISSRHSKKELLMLKMIQIQM